MVDGKEDPHAIHSPPVDASDIEPEGNQRMKLKVAGTLLLLFGTAIWWRTALSSHNEPASGHRITTNISKDGATRDPVITTQGQRQHRDHLEKKDLKNSLASMKLSIEADIIGSSSAEGSIRLHGANEFEIASEELKISHSTGDLIMVGPSQLRSPTSRISVSGKGALMRINPDGSFSSKGETKIEVKVPKTAQSSPRD